MSLRKAIKTRGPFPSEDAALKVMYLAFRNLAGKWHSVQGLEGGPQLLRAALGSSLPRAPAGKDNAEFIQIFL
jgi:hypothetical protein